MVAIYLTLFVAHFLLTVWFVATGHHDSLINYAYNLTTTLFVLVPFVQSLTYIRRYPTLKPVVIGLMVSNLSFFVAQVIWFYFNVFSTIEMPYPSIADFFYLLFYPGNILAMLALNALTKQPWSKGQITSFIALCSIFIAITLAFLRQTLDFTDSPAIIILNLTYPTADAIIAALGITILRSQNRYSYNYLFLYVFGYVCIAIGDVFFALQTTNNSYWNGNFVDLLYAFSHFLIALGTNFLPSLLKPVPTIAKNY